MYTSYRNPGVNPPIPTTNDSSTKKSAGQRLLTLVRSLEKNSDDISKLEEAIGILQQLISVTQRLGLLQGDEQLAEKVLSRNNSTSMSSNKQQGAGGGNNNTSRRRRGKAGQRNDLTIHQNEEDGGKKDSTAASLDVNLLMSAVTRILGGATNSSKTESSSRHDDWWVANNRRLLVILAADLCTAMCEFIMSSMQSPSQYCYSTSDADRCVIVAEYEIVAASGNVLLAGLDRTAQALLLEIKGSSSLLFLYQPCSDQDEHVAALISCLRAAASLVCLFGTKLSRSASLLAGLRNVGWQALAVVDENVVRAAAILLSSLPYAGGTGGGSPSDLWATSIADSVVSLSSALQMVMPKNRTTATEDLDADGVPMSDHAKDIVTQWIGGIQSTDSEESRVESFLQLMSGLAQFLSCLLEKPTPRPNRKQELLVAEVDLFLILDLIETMLSLPVASEAVYYGTKKRLRLEVIDGGLLSSVALARDVANKVKLLGLGILIAFLGSIGGPVLLPFAERIQRMSRTALLTSLSTPLRRILDPSSAIQLDGKRKRWLHASALVRASSIKAFQATIDAFGVEPSTAASTSFRSNSSDEFDRGISLVGGCIVEQLLDNKERHVSGDWGSSLERLDVLISATNCLTSCLTNGGEYLSEAARALVDSIANKCLLSIIQDTSTCAEAIAAFLSLGIACISTPWPDGAMSSIVGEVELASRKCENDSDASVSSTARLALQLCETASTPRVPALQVISQTNAPSGYNASQIVSAEAMVDMLESTPSAVARSHPEDQVASDKALNDKSAQGSNKRSKIEGSSDSCSHAEGKKWRPSKEGEEAPTLSRPQQEQQNDGKKEIDATNPNSRKEYKAGTLVSDTNVKTDTKRSALAAHGAAKDEPQEVDEDDDDFPMIVDCAPDGDE